MKYIVIAIVVGLFVVAAVVVFALNSKVGVWRQERDQALEEKAEAQARLNTARRALVQIAGDLTGNPKAEAAAALDDIEADHNDGKKINR